MNSYQDFILRELKNRKHKNPAYSLRAFAKSLNITAAHLSLVLSRKRKLSKSLAVKILRVLKLNDTERDLFLAYHVKNSSLDPVEVSQAEEKIRELLSSDVFNVIKDSEIDFFSSLKFATIFELMSLKNFQSDIKWISNKLKISQIEVSKILDRMEQLGYARFQDGKWIILKKNFATPTITSEYIRRFHREAFEKAKEALISTPMEKRDFSSIIMSIDSSKIDLAKEKLREFRRNFFREFGGGEEKDSVYCLSVQFFSLVSSEDDAGF